MNVALALVGVCLAASSGVWPGLFARERPRLATGLSVGAMLVAAMNGIVAALRALLGFGDTRWTLNWELPGASFDIRLDPIAGMFLIQVFLIGALGSVYGIGYWSPSEHPKTVGRLRLFYGLMVGGMALLILANNSILFLFGWEVMALAAFLALTVEDYKRETRECGFVYLVATRLGTLAIMAMFALLRSTTASFALEPGSVSADTPVGIAIFCLGVFGFGLKAGLMPLHVWLPAAHANAPTHVSALMSGVLIKMGIFGILRIIPLFTHLPISWGICLFVLGATSAVLGVVFALGQHDLKRLLAYHSVENIGIIVMALGVAMVGRSTSRPELLALGLAAALLHTFNHGVFKSLLFFGAGSVINCAKTRLLDRMGGIARILPITTVAFLIGALAICGLPPLNGFISELFLYLSMLLAGTKQSSASGTLLLFGVPVLAMVGALAVACFVKVVGVVFLGEQRSELPSLHRESPPSMLAPMVVLSAVCIAIGTTPGLVTTMLDRATRSWSSSPTTVQISALVPLRYLTWGNWSLLIATLVIGSASWLAVRRRDVATGPTWDCGYLAPSPRMQYSATSFAESLVALFSIVLRPEKDRPNLDAIFPSRARFESHVPEVVLDLLLLPLLRGLLKGVGWFRWLQPGGVHRSIVYVLVTLVAIMAAWH